MSRLNSGVAALILANLLLPVQASAEGSGWNGPVTIKLPAPTRTILLRRDVDAVKWRAENGLASASGLPMGRETLLQFPMTEAEWVQRQPALCGSAQVAQCASAVCQTMQFSAAVTGAQDEGRVKARLVKKTPAVPPMEIESSATSCRKPLAAALTPAGEEAGAVIDLSQAGDLLSTLGQESRTSTTSTQGSAPAGSGAATTNSTGNAQGASTTASDQASVGAEGNLRAERASSEVEALSEPNPVQSELGEVNADAAKLTASDSADSGLPEIVADQAAPTAGGDQNTVAESAPGADGSQGSPDHQRATPAAVPFQVNLQGELGRPLEFALTDLPADTTQYDLVVGEGCGEVRIPLESLAPASVPLRITALITADANDLAQDYGLALLDETPLLSIDARVATFESTLRDVPTSIAMLLLDPRVSLAQREFIYTTAAAEYSDTYARFSYGPQATGALALHPATAGATQTIAVIDTGVAESHPELQGRVTTTDFTGNGWSADAHGTAVAGIIAAAANNAQGIYGVAPQTNLLALKACEPEVAGGLRARCWSSSLAKALDAAIQQGVAVINMSLAGPPDELVARFVRQAVEKNILVVAGAGNGGPQARPAYPAAMPEVLAVTAVDRLGRAYRQANQGAYVDIAAPGVDIITTAIEPDQYPQSSGTSWAAAHVSGLAALLLDLAPLLSVPELIHHLTFFTTDLGASGKDVVFGRGLVDVCRAASAATAEAVVCPDETEPLGSTGL